MNLAVSLALTMAGPLRSPSKASSIRSSSTMDENKRPASICSNLYNGVSDRPLGWKSRRLSIMRVATQAGPAKELGLKRWDGIERSSVEWDGLRRDPELWFSDGNCLVHLYGRGQSRRGPAFKVPMDALIAAQCFPLLERFLIETSQQSPNSESSTEGYFSSIREVTYELYIPAPATAERGQAFLYHTSTRNFFAWLFGKSLVGTHLGGALVGLMNSLTEFRSQGEDNVEAIMNYMDEEGYADLRSHPDHALAILYFAEHFHFKDLWTDAFVHCVGMNERLSRHIGFEHLARTSRALISRSRLELDLRLEQCGRRLGSFMSDQLSEAHIGLSLPARAHLDKFRSFLHSYYVAKLGYYPPASDVNDSGSASFPKHIYGQMCSEFGMLYEYLVDNDFESADTLSVSKQGGICVLQNVNAFDQRHKYQTLKHPLCLLPEEAASKPKQTVNTLFSFAKADKMRPDARLVTLASLTKATNARDQTLLDCSLVRAYRGFEKDCVFSKYDKPEKLSHVDARKVRWILVYTVYQTLLSASRIPDEVRDTHNVPYELCVQIAGCHPWSELRPYENLLRTQTDQMKEDYLTASMKPGVESSPVTPMRMDIRPDIDYFAITHKQHARGQSDPSPALFKKMSTVKKALSTLGNMPELIHPKPHRLSHHEILIRGYGNGINATTTITAGSTSNDVPKDISTKLSSESASSSEDVSSRWSHTDVDDNGSSSRASLTYSCTDSDASVGDKSFIAGLLDTPLKAFDLPSPTSIYSQDSHYKSNLPDPLSLKLADDQLLITTDVKIEYSDCLIDEMEYAMA